MAWYLVICPSTKAHNDLGFPFYTPVKGIKGSGFSNEENVSLVFRLGV